MSGPTFGLPMEGSKLPGKGMGKYRKLVITASQELSDPSDGKADWFRVSVTGGGAGGNYGHSNGTSLVPGWGGGAGETLISTFHKSEISFPVQITIGAAGKGGIAPTTTGAAASTNGGVWPTCGGSTSFGTFLTACGAGISHMTYNSGYMVAARGGQPIVLSSEKLMVQGSTNYHYLTTGGSNSAIGAYGYNPPAAGYYYDGRVFYISGGSGGNAGKDESQPGGNCSVFKGGAKNLGSGGGASFYGDGASGPLDRNTNSPKPPSATAWGAGGAGGWIPVDKDGPFSGGSDGIQGVCIIEWYE